MKTEVIKLIENRDDVTLTAFVWKDSPELMAGMKRPAVIICPGGAYFNCSDREATPVALAFAAMGYHAFVLRYSVYGGNVFDTGFQNITVKTECQYPRPMQDIGRAILYIRDHAEQWNVDCQKIAICGFSAGAHNCAMYANNWAKPVMTEHFGRPAEDFRPAACILGYPLTDYVYAGVNHSLNPMDAAFHAASTTAYLGEHRNDPHYLTEVSPCRNVNENTPPTYIWATAADALVPVQHFLFMAQGLADQKIPFELHIFEDGPHGLSTSTQASAPSKSMIFPDAAKWVPMVDCWLQKRFALPLPALAPFEEFLVNGSPS